MKHRIFLITTAALMSVTLLISAAGPGDTPQEKYIQKYAPVAVSEMYRSGVPASITLAQGLLESGDGTQEGTLARAVSTQQTHQLALR